MDDINPKWIEDCRQKLLDNQTIPEIRVGRFLLDMGITYTPQQPFVINGKVYFADFDLTPQKVIIELDGRHHSEKEFKKYDKKRDKNFSSIGYKTIRINNKNCYNYLKFAQTLFQCDKSLFLYEPVSKKRKNKKKKIKNKHETRKNQ